MNGQYKRFLAKARKRRQEAYKMWSSGMSYAQIGRKLGVSRQRARMLVIAN